VCYRPGVADKGSDKLIFERTLLAAVASLLPVPFIDDYLLKRGRKTLLRDVGKRSGLELTDEVLDELATPPPASALARAGMGLAGRFTRGVALPLRVVDRARAALVTFERATLLDHFATRHKGQLSMESAKRLRRRMDQALAAVPLRSLRVPTGHADALRAAFDAVPDGAP